MSAYVVIDQNNVPPLIGYRSRRKAVVGGISLRLFHPCRLVPGVAWVTAVLNLLQMLQNVLSLRGIVASEME